MPAELLRQVDELAGPRGRSRFIAEALKDGVRRAKRERLREALDATAGASVGTPSHMTPDEAYRWVRSMREEDND
jgi:hypothetical protein